MMPTIRQLDVMQSADVGTMDKNTLADARSVPFDRSLSKRERIGHIFERMKNPYCFRYGGLGVKVEFTEKGPALTELLADFFLRRKSGP